MPLRFRDIRTSRSRYGAAGRPGVPAMRPAAPAAADPRDEIIRRLEERMARFEQLLMERAAAPARSAAPAPATALPHSPVRTPPAREYDDGRWKSPGIEGQTGIAGSTVRNPLGSDPRLGNPMSGMPGVPGGVGTPVLQPGVPIDWITDPAIYGAENVAVFRGAIFAGFDEFGNPTARLADGRTAVIAPEVFARTPFAGQVEQARIVAQQPPDRFDVHDRYTGPTAPQPDSGKPLPPSPPADGSTRIEGSELVEGVSVETAATEGEYLGATTTHAIYRMPDGSIKNVPLVGASAPAMPPRPTPAAPTAAATPIVEPPFVEDRTAAATPIVEPPQGDAALPPPPGPSDSLPAGGFATEPWRAPAEPWPAPVEESPYTPGAPMSVGERDLLARLREQYPDASLDELLNMGTGA